MTHTPTKPMPKAMPSKAPTTAKAPAKAPTKSPTKAATPKKAAPVAKKPAPAPAKSTSSMPQNASPAANGHQVQNADNNHSLGTNQSSTSSTGGYRPWGSR